MATQVQLRRGTAAQNNSFTGAAGELTFDTTNKRVRIHDGSTAGGFELKTENSSGDTLFADNEKAIFGAGSDLQIFHDPANGSIVKDNGTGRLLLDSENGTGISLTSGGIAKTMISATKDSDVKLYHNGSQKLATTSTGIDVTGTVTADGIISSQKLEFNASESALVTTGSTAKVYATNSTFDGINGSLVMQSRPVAGADVYIATGAAPKTVAKFNDGGDISFYEDTGTTAKFFWDASAESLGIGTASPSSLLHLNSAYPKITLNDTQGVNRAFSVGTNNETFTVRNETGSTDALVIDNNNNVGIGTAPARKLHVVDTSGGNVALLSNGIDADLDINLTSGVTLLTPSTGTLAFGTSATERMRIDSSGNVGIGVSPTTKLDVKDGSSRFAFQDASGSARIVLDGADGDFAGGDYSMIESDGSANLVFHTSATERARIDTSGNLLVGTTDTDPYDNTSSSGFGIALRENGSIYNARYQGTPIVTNRIGNNGKLMQFRKDGVEVGNISSVGGSDIQVVLSSDGDQYITGNAASNYMTFSTANAEAMRIDSNGNVGIGVVPTRQFHIHDSSGDNNLHITNSTTGTTATSGFTIVSQSSTNDVLLNQRASANIRFYTGGAEKMRIDSSGNLLVGKTSAVGASTVGAEVRPDGDLISTRSGAQPLTLNRTTSDGDIAQFRKDNTTVGSIGSYLGDSYVGTGSAGLRFYDAGPAITPHNTTTNAGTDGTIDLGTSAGRFKDLYATNGTIQTSDQNEKQDIAELSDAEQRVAVAAKGLLRKFRWKDAVAEKGDEARTHFGIIAQDLQAAFAAEGLDAGDYAMFIHTTWTDEETGEERSRMGVRYSELLAFIISAI